MSRKELIVVALPGGSHANYYKRLLGGSVAPIVAMFSELSTKVAEGGDIFMVLYHRNDQKLIDGSAFHGDTRFLQIKDPLDLWMRDFTSTIPELQVKFRYQPNYLKKREAKLVETDFIKLLRNELNLNFPEEKLSKITLDCGNIVENGTDKAIITKRALSDNKNMTEDQFQMEVESHLKRRVCLLGDPGDTTGHADGLVAFLDHRILFLADYGDPDAYKASFSIIQSTFGCEIDVIKLACFETKPGEMTGAMNDPEMDSAFGAYINMLVTDRAVYVPQFGVVQDQEALDTVRAHTNKGVFGINTKELSHMGGSVRCMTWQLNEDIGMAKSLIAASKNKTVKQ